MQVEVDMKCMQTNFLGHGLSGFGNLLFQIWVKNRNEKNQLKKIMQVEVDVKFIQTHFKQLGDHQ